MNVSQRRIDPVQHATPLLVVPAFQAEEDAGETGEGGADAPAPPGGVLARLDARLGGAIDRARAEGDFKGGDDESLLLYPPGEGNGGPRRVLVLGGGSRDGVSAETVRRLAGRAVRRAEGISVRKFAFYLEEDGGIGAEAAAQAATEGAMLAAWDFREEKTEGGGTPPRPLVESMELDLPGAGEEVLSEGIRVGRALSNGANLARALQNRPGNVATPIHLAGVAEEMAAEHGLEATILGPEEIREEGMHALLAVAQGSEQEPRFIVLEHRGGEEGERPVVLVGKGLTFDAGGISIKPARGMEDMKFDMSGGAAVIGAMRAVGELRPAVNVVGVVPATENLVSGRAMKPGDIIRTRAGRSVEVINTDAEGRLILADALSWASDLEPAAVVDCATLTGSCVVALGHHAAALLGTNEELLEELQRAGERSGERCWTLPLWDEYRKQLDSKYADMKNVGGRPAGTITAGWFLREFVGEARWAHIDIAGTAYGEAKVPYLRDGGFGFPTRLLVEWVRGRAASGGSAVRG